MSKESRAVWTTVATWVALIAIIEHLCHHSEKTLLLRPCRSCSAGSEDKLEEELMANLSHGKFVQTLTSVVKEHGC